MKELHKNLIFIFAMGIIIAFLGLLFSFLISRFLLGEPVLPYLPEVFTPAQYDQMYHQLGLDQPLIVQFIKYMIDMLTGNWGISISVARGIPVQTLMTMCIPRTVDMLCIPLIACLLLKLFLKKRSTKTRWRFGKHLTQGLVIAILAIPIPFLVMSLQYLFGHVAPIFPTIGYKTYSYKDPPLVTGFRVLDSFLSGNLYLIPDYLNHLILPWITLTIAMVSFTIFGKRLQIFNESNQTTRIIKFPFTNRLFKTSFLFGMVITFSLMVDWIFAFSGVGHLFVIAVYNADYFIVSACLFSISLLFAILVTISLLFNLRVNMRKHQICEDLVGPPLNDQNDECISIKNNDIKKIQQLKLEFNALVRFLLKKLNSPFTVIGLWIIICAILISIFPQILTPYTLDEANGLYSPWYGFPSPDHLLGTTIYGRDVLVRIIFGVRNSLFFGISTVAIGLLGGLICGILINFIKRRFNISLEGVLIPVYMYPIMLSVLFGTFGLRTLLKTGTKIEYTVLVFGLLMIPIFIQLIANSKLSLLDISKKIISNAPLFMGFVLMINFFLEFLGFSDWKFIQLGNEVLYAREYLYNAPWASFYPNLAQFFLLFGLFLLHMGLREAPMEQQKLQRN